MTETHVDWVRNRLDAVLRKDRRIRDTASLALLLSTAVAVTVLWGFSGSLLALYLALVFLAIVLAAIQIPMRWAAYRNPTEVRISPTGVRLRSQGGDERFLPHDRIHRVHRAYDEMDVVYYFGEDGWLRSVAVDKELGHQIETARLKAHAERGPFGKPPVTFRPLVTIPWLVLGSIVLGLGLPAILTSLAPYDRTLYVWGTLGTVAGVAMLVYGALTFIWWVRERKRRARGEATAMLFAGLE